MHSMVPTLLRCYHTLYRHFLSWTERQSRLERLSIQVENRYPLRITINQRGKQTINVIETLVAVSEKLPVIISIEVMLK